MWVKERTKRPHKGLTQFYTSIWPALDSSVTWKQEVDDLAFQVSALADDLMRKCALSRPDAVRIGKKINGYIRQMSIVTQRMMATVSELSLVQVWLYFMTCESLKISQLQ